MLRWWQPALVAGVVGCAGADPGPQHPRPVASAEPAGEPPAARPGSGSGETNQAKPEREPGGEARVEEARQGEPAWGRAALARRAREREPALAALEQRSRARLAAAREAGALPAPMAMAQLWQAPLRAPFVYGDDSMVMVGVQQTFPPAAARRAGAQAAESEAGLASAEETALAREVGAAVALAAADLREATAAAELHAGHRGLLERVRQVALARVATGGGLNELARAERELAAREVDQAQALGLAEQARAELNGRLGREGPEPLELAPEPLGSPTEPLAALQARAREQSPALAAAAAAVRRDGARADEADRMRRSPAVTVGLNYGLMGPHAPSFHTWGATFSMTLPWLDAGARARHEGRLAERDAGRLDDASQRRRLDREVATAHARALAAARTLTVVDGRLLPAARRAVEASRAGQASGGVELTASLEALRDLREAELARLQAATALERALIELERLVGGPIALTPLPASPGGPHGH